LQLKILIDIGHPGHVHLFKNLYHDLINRGHKIVVTVKDIPVAIELLDSFHIPYIIIGRKPDSISGKIFSQIGFNYRTWKIIRKNKIDIGIGTSFTLAQISKISKMKSIILDDDDDDVEPFFVKFVHPFCDTLLSPDVLKGKRKRKDTVYYPGFHELAYLHPNRFKPDEGVLKEIGLQKEDTFFVLRFNVFKAHHDVGATGLTIEQKLKLVEYLQPHGKIFITTERNIEPELEKYRLSISLDKIHSLIYFAGLFIGDSQTMTSEAAVLGTPSIRCNSFVGRISYLEEEQHRYHLTFGFKPDDFDKLLGKVKELLSTSNLKEDFQKRRQKLLDDKIDVTSFLVWFVENYPESVRIMKENPEYQERFR